MLLQKPQSNNHQISPHFNIKFIFGDFNLLVLNKKLLDEEVWELCMFKDENFYDNFSLLQKKVNARGKF